MASYQPKVPEKVESTIMFDSDHTCCICRGRGKDVQIHHIDGDNTNNDESNLAVLCLDCHSKVTGSRGLGRKYSQLEIEKYKRDWEYSVRKNRGLIHEPSRTMKKAELILLESDIRRSVYEFAATEDVNRAKEILGFLEILHIFERPDEYILDLFHLIVPFVSGSGKGSLLAEHVSHYFLHLASPNIVKIKKKDIKNINRAVRVLTWLGEMQLRQPVRNVDVMNSVFRSLNDIIERAKTYHLEKLTSEISKCYRSLADLEESITGIR